IWRTAFSVVVGEALDFACEILDTQGRVIATAWESMPTFNFALPNTVKAVLKRFPLESLEEGDVIFTNDPWLCAGHLFDIAALTPVFNRDGKPVAIMGSVANVADIGGTRARHTAREVYDEGLFIPPLKLYRAGELNEQLVEIIENNVRLPSMALGDIHAMVSANALGAERVKAFLDTYGLDTLDGLAEEIFCRSERAMRDAISAVPDGVYEAEQWCDGVEEPFRFRLQVEVNGDAVAVDLLDVPEQFPYGGTNVTLSILVADITYLLKCIFTPQVPANDGDFRPMTVRAPKGSVLNCKRPASVGQRVRTLWTVPPALMRALAPVLPDNVQAHTGFPAMFKTYGYTSKGEAFSDHLFQGGGQGASSRRDGDHTLLFPTSARNVSVEMFEMRTGFLVEEKEFIPDSGGPGKFRGAPGQRVTIRRRPRESGGKYQIGIWPTGLRTDTPGPFGGQAGSRMRLFTVAEPGEPAVDHFGSRGIFVEMDEKLRITLELPGGAGFGEPRERAPEAIRRDIEEGIVTPEGARAQYVWEDQAE
ncbi:MAG: hydantoinase B/oxoprolinase family protein, partial [Nitrospinota bacterium]|nr:hydantoinase B/oxoprolinase family protein [Nitrospinota bacterium]